MSQAPQLSEKLPGSCYAPQVRARLWLSNGVDAYLGRGRIDLMQAIVQTGSISAAAKTLGMSYRRAWNLVEEINAMADTPLIMSHAGGKGGGGAEVTPLGMECLSLYAQVEQQIKQALIPLEDQLAKLRKG